MKTIHLITTFCLLTTFWFHPQNESEKIEQLTEKIIAEEAKAAFFKPGPVTGIVMYGAAVLAMIRISPLALGIYERRPIPDSDINIITQESVKILSFALIAKIIRSYSRSLQEVCLIKKKAYEKQLELISNKRAL